MKDSNESKLNEIPNKELKRLIEQMFNKLENKWTPSKRKQLNKLKMSIQNIKYK